jgi:hypothetical protein
MLRRLLSKIGEGIFLGIGAGLTVGLVMYLQTRWAMSEMEEMDFGMSEQKSYSSEAKLSIKSHRPKAVDDSSAFIGQVVNNGSDTWTYVRLLVELFDSDGNFIGKCTDTLDGPIRPDQVRNFEISCSGCRNSTVPKFDRYTVEIVDASYEQPESGA